MKNQVKMLKTLNGVDDGQLHPSTFYEGHEYAIGQGLLNDFISLGGVELIGGSFDPEKRETKPFEISKLNKKQLIAFAKDNFGLELDEDIKKEEMLVAIEKATEATP